MKPGIHPEYSKALITCACGRVTETRSAVGELHVEICSHCHPFFTGRQKLVDTAGRVERFMAKYGIEGESSGAEDVATDAPTDAATDAADAEDTADAAEASTGSPTDDAKQEEAAVEA